MDLFPVSLLEINPATHDDGDDVAVPIGLVGGEGQGQEGQQGQEEERSRRSEGWFGHNRGQIWTSRQSRYLHREGQEEEEATMTSEVGAASAASTEEPRQSAGRASSTSTVRSSPEDSRQTGSPQSESPGNGGNLISSLRKNTLFCHFPRPSEQRQQQQESPSSPVEIPLTEVSTTNQVVDSAKEESVSNVKPQPAGGGLQAIHPVKGNNLY